LLPGTASSVAWKPILECVPSQSAAPAKRKLFGGRHFLAVGVKHRQAAGYDVGSVPQNLNCGVSHAFLFSPARLNHLQSLHHTIQLAAIVTTLVAYVETIEAACYL
jgi:hypothetical protein